MKRKDCTPPRARRAYYYAYILVLVQGPPPRAVEWKRYYLIRLINDGVGRSRGTSFNDKKGVNHVANERGTSFVNGGTPPPGPPRADLQSPSLGSGPIWV